MERECMVCFEEGVSFIKLACSHELCHECYPKVVRLNGLCPMCLQPIETTIQIPKKYAIVALIICTFLTFSILKWAKI
jgi:predicted amidophosphoribosyltransferase